MNTSDLLSPPAPQAPCWPAPPATPRWAEGCGTDAAVLRRLLERSRQHLGCERRDAQPEQRALRVRWARHAEEVRAAQRLRHEVFAGELGAQLRCPPGTPPGLDVDRFDDACEHLLVVASGSDDEAEAVVGTYRMLTPQGARRMGGLYSDGEFDLAPLDALRPMMGELGRSCTHPQWRHGGVMMLLWGALAEGLQRHGLRHVVGCASVSMRDGGHNASALWHRLRDAALIEPALRVRPWLGLPIQPGEPGQRIEVPPLVKGYLRCGARLLGAPAWDPDFQVADLPLLLALSDLPQAMRRRQFRSH